MLDVVFDQAIVDRGCELEDLVLLSEFSALRGGQKGRLLAKLKRRVVDLAVWRVPDKSVRMLCEFLAPEI